MAGNKCMELTFPRVFVAFAYTDETYYMLDKTECWKGTWRTDLLLLPSNTETKVSGYWHHPLSILMNSKRVDGLCCLVISGLYCCISSWWQVWIDSKEFHYSHIQFFRQLMVNWGMKPQVLLSPHRYISSLSSHPPSCTIHQPVPIASIIFLGSLGVTSLPINTHVMWSNDGQSKNASQWGRWKLQKLNH